MLMMQEITADIVQATIRPREADTYKGDYGHVLTVGGNQNYGGAIIMSTMAAVYGGAGLVTAATDPSNFTSLHAQLPEAMVVDDTDVAELTKLIPTMNVIVVGPGLGTDQQAQTILETVFDLVLPKQILIIDGSAIDLVAAQKMTLPDTHIIFTPHVIEWQRLTGIAPDDQTPEKNQAAQQKLHANVVLKKHRTEVYMQDQIWQNTVGGPALATGGSGDTLTGVIAAFVAQFENKQKALLSAVYTHSKISDQLAENAYVTLPTMISHALPSFMAQMAKKTPEDRIGF
ncbi:carbohydrate kinase, YjeF related protein [Lactobacillus selangorensis]|uniref:ADP-dependent (S)-NAD(P)H-hydrate dehydratase n=2 Tax=Lactobacillus selangorensis TaxID=81857 RepID=A0A0R2G690_9LACO|nr:carbohydrate kinase, YjeF related protein [Lactobacillus selangorensis]KRN33701.1 carbohydrate kinase, YjeF related protein [Lactobacillus selangorensis]